MTALKDKGKEQLYKRLIPNDRQVYKVTIEKKTAANPEPRIRTLGNQKIQLKRKQNKAIANGRKIC